MRGSSGSRPTSWRGYGSGSTRRAPWATGSRRPPWRCPSGSDSWGGPCPSFPTGTSPCPPESSFPVSISRPARASPPAPPMGSPSLSGSGPCPRRNPSGKRSAHPFRPRTTSCRGSEFGSFDPHLSFHREDHHPPGLLREGISRKGAEAILHPQPAFPEHRFELIARVDPHVERGGNPDPLLAGQHVLRGRTPGPGIESYRHPELSRRDLDRLVPVLEARQALPGVSQVEKQGAPLPQAHRHVIQNPLVLLVAEEPEGSEQGEAQIEGVGSPEEPHVLAHPFHDDPLPAGPRPGDVQHPCGKVHAGHHVPPPGERDGMPPPTAPQVLHGRPGRNREEAEDLLHFLQIGRASCRGRV